MRLDATRRASAGPGGRGCPPIDRSVRSSPHGSPASRRRPAPAASSIRCRSRSQTRATGRAIPGRASRLSTLADSRSRPTRARTGRVLAAAGQDGPAGPSRSSGNRATEAAGSCRVAQTSRGVACTKTRRSTVRAARRWSPGRRYPTSGSGRTAMLRPRSGARPSSSRGRRRSIPGVRWRGRPASRSGARRRSSAAARSA